MRVRRMRVVGVVRMVGVVVVVVTHNPIPVVNVRCGVARVILRAPVAAALRRAAAWDVVSPTADRETASWRLIVFVREQENSGLALMLSSSSPIIARYRAGEREMPFLRQWFVRGR